MTRPIASSLSLLLLLSTAVVRATVSRSDELATTLSPTLNTSVWRSNEKSAERNTSSPERILASFEEDGGEGEQPNPSEDEVEDEDEEDSENEEENEDLNDSEDDGKDEDENEEYEGEDSNEDEYVDELKAVAESHEAMSRDDTGNSNATTRIATASIARFQPPPDSAGRTFESQEKLLTNQSDEDVASNEAITDEFYHKNQDEQVAELLRYKKERNSNARNRKSKRVPTVKKELSTQKEILLASNETQVAKSLLPPDDALDSFNGPTSSEPFDEISRVESSNDDDLGPDNRYTDIGRYSNSRRRVDKRQETLLKNLKSDLLAEYAAEQLERRKLHVRSALAKSMLKLIVLLADNSSEQPDPLPVYLPELDNIEDQPTMNQEAAKRAYDPSSSSLAEPTSSPASQPTRPRKKPKKKKKKKKQRQRKLSAKATSQPASDATGVSTSSPSYSSATEPSSRTTPSRWRLVAERLFSQPWRDSSRDDPDRRFPATGSDRNSSHGTTSSDLLSGQSDGRTMRFGKINTHLPTDQPDRRERPPVYHRYQGADHSRNIEQEDRVFSRLTHDRLTPNPPNFVRDIPEDYQDDLDASNTFARNHEYTQSNGEFAASKSWPDLSREVERPRWNEQGRSSISKQTGWLNPWRENDAKFQPRHSSNWRSDDFWTRPSNRYSNKIANGNPWLQPQRQIPIHSWKDSGTPLNVPSWPDDADVKIRDGARPSAPWNVNGNNRSDQGKPSAKGGSGKEDVVLPKITMKAWNSLTSDPATWPYKLPGAKPWPKDKNGKSYNPNAELMRKLGLDTVQRAWPKDKQAKAYDAKTEFMRKLAREDDNDDDEARGWPNDEGGRSYPFEGQHERGKFFSPSESWRPLEPDKKPWSANLPGARTENERNLPRSSEQDSWKRKYHSPIRDWWLGRRGVSAKDSLLDESPKIQSVGAWVMPADRSSWSPYEIKMIDDDVDDDPVGERRDWSVNSNQGHGSWNAKVKGIPPWTSNRNLVSDSWTAKVNDDDRWSRKPTSSNTWLGQSPKSGNSWHSDDSWKENPRDLWLENAKSRNDDLLGSMDSKEPLPWSSRTPDDDTSRSLKTKDVDAWGRRISNNPWTGETTNPWLPISKSGTEVVPESSQRKSPDPWHSGSPSDNSSGASKSKPEATWGSRSESDAWTGKSNDVSSWISRRNGAVDGDNGWSSGRTNGVSNAWGEQRAKPTSDDQQSGSWATKVSDEWSSAYAKDTGASNSWPASKWKQFAYHRVTAVPVTKPGDSSDASVAKSKNAFVAVSAVASPKYGASEWRKNEVAVEPFVTRNDRAIRRVRSDDVHASAKDGAVRREERIYARKENVTDSSDASVAKSKNAFVAVSAVESPKYGTSEWRKNDAHGSAIDGTVEREERIYARKKNVTDKLESQLENLGRATISPRDTLLESTEITQPVNHSLPISPTNSTSTRNNRNEIAKRGDFAVNGKSVAEIGVKNGVQNGIENRDGNGVDNGAENESENESKNEIKNERETGSKDRGVNGGAIRRMSTEVSQ